MGNTNSHINFVVSFSDLIRYNYIYSVGNKELHDLICENSEIIFIHFSTKTNSYIVCIEYSSPQYRMEYKTRRLVKVKKLSNSDTLKRIVNQALAKFEDKFGEWLVHKEERLTSDYIKEIEGTKNKEQKHGKL